MSSGYYVTVPFLEHLGAEFVRAEPGRLEMALVLKDFHLNNGGVVHGGVILTLLDICMSGVGRTLDDGSRYGVTLEVKTSFFQPGGSAGGRLTAVGRLAHRTRSILFCEGEVRDAEDRLIAKGMGTFKFADAQRNAPRDA